MKLVMIEADGKVCPGRIEGDCVVELGGLGTDLRSILESGHLERARSAEGRSIPLGNVKLLSPQSRDRSFGGHELSPASQRNEDAGTGEAGGVHEKCRQHYRA